MVSWYDKGFKLSDEDYKKLNEKEKNNYVKQIVKATNIINDTQFFKYIFIDKWIFKDEEEFKLKCPNIFSLLEKHKKKLLNRYWSKKIKYWEWATIRNKNIFNKNRQLYVIPSITRKNNVKFTLIKNKNLNIYSWGDVITLTFKEHIKENKQKEILNIINSKEYIKYLNDNVLRKGNRKMFSQVYISSLKF